MLTLQGEGLKAFMTHRATAITLGGGNKRCRKPKTLPVGSAQATELHVPFGRTPDILRPFNINLGRHSRRDRALRAHAHAPCFHLGPWTGFVQVCP